MESTIVLNVAITISILALASFVLAFSDRFKLPFSIVLVLVGVLISHGVDYGPHAIQTIIENLVSPNLILYICLPTLIFESAFHLEGKQIQDNLLPILFFAIPGFLLSVVIIGFIITFFTSLPIGEGLLLGAILSATDPVAVVSLFKKLGTPKRLTILIEGESLFNDATAIVLAKIIYALVIAGLVGHEHVWTNLLSWHGIAEFFYEFFGGIGVGLVVAYLFGSIISWVESNALIEISLTTILAYVVFLIGEQLFHVSGVIATLTAGLVMSGWGRTKISPSVLKHIEQFWDFLAYIANALVFLLVGLSIQLDELSGSLGIITVVIFGMLLSRAVVIFVLTPIIAKLPKSRPIDKKYQTVLFWGGLRGAIALAIVLGFGPFEHRNLFVAVVLGSVLFTLLIQGLTIDKLVRLLGLDKPSLPIRLAKAQGFLTATKRSLAYIPELQTSGLFSARIAEKADEKCHKSIDKLKKELDDLNQLVVEQGQEKQVIFYQVIAAQKTFYYEQFSKGHLSGAVYLTLIDYLDLLSDIVRYKNDVATLPLIPAPRKKLTDYFIRLLDYFHSFESLLEKIRNRSLAKSYEVIWGVHQGAGSALIYIEEIERSETFNQSALQRIKNYFQESLDATTKQLDSFAEQFPEFVTLMQNRLAERMMIGAERETVHEMAISGRLPAALAESMEKDLEKAIRQLRERPGRRVELNPAELLKKVPFLKGIAAAEFKKLTELLHERVSQAGEVIIRQGKVGESLFLIMRGVVRVSREEKGAYEDLATLMSGDFFGEMALLHKERRVATCRAITPCALYELRREDFEKFVEHHPSIKKAIESIDIKRRASLRSH